MSKLLDDEFRAGLSDHADFLRNVAEGFHNLASGKYTVYADLLSHLIKETIPLQMEDGHCFKMERERSAGCTHTLIATDAKDGKRYRVTVEPITEPTRGA